MRKYIIILIISAVFFNVAFLWAQEGSGMINKKVYSNEELITRQKIALLEKQIIQFQEKNKKLPDLLKNITVLEKNSEPQPEASLTDAWGEDLLYFKQKNSFTIVSKGKDKVFGTNDDIVQVKITGNFKK
ncbi:MAG: type II secretion system protein GspG [Candidatus Omnitrophota bacterium]